MRTQSIDTHPEAERVMIELIREAPMSKRFRLVQSLTQSALWSSFHAWRERNREASEQEAAVQVVSTRYSADLARCVQEALERRGSWHVQPIDLMAAMLPAVRAFDHLGVSSYLAGSIASSLHGMQQLAQDVDLVVNLPASSIAPLLTLLKPSFALDEDAMREAVLTCSPCSLIHLDTLLKVDVIQSRPSLFEAAVRPLVAAYTLDERYPPVRVASACEMILFKLQRYQRDERSRSDGMRDDSEWNDVEGMLKVQGPDLDLALLERWANTLAGAETWRQALADAGIAAA
jgi:hypothetical protein